MTEIELKHPHGQLLTTGKKTAILTPDDLPAGEPVRVSGVGVVVLGEPALMLASEADRKEWQDRHRVRPSEREAWWPGAQRFRVYPVAQMRLDMEDWKAADDEESGEKYDAGQPRVPAGSDGGGRWVSDGTSFHGTTSEAANSIREMGFAETDARYPHANTGLGFFFTKSRKEAEVYAGTQGVVLETNVTLRNPKINDTWYDLKDEMVKQTRGNISKPKQIKEYLRSMGYDGVVFRNPTESEIRGEDRSWIVAFDNDVIDVKEAIRDTLYLPYPLVPGGKKAEDDEMPYELAERDGKTCVVKEETKEPVEGGCHEKREDAEAHLAALRINVEAEEKDAEELKACDEEEEKAEMLPCWKCGNPYPADAKECPKCGAPREEPEAEKESGSSDGKVQVQKDDVAVAPEPEQKAGARLKRTWRQKLEDAVTQLKELLSWSHYEDQTEAGNEFSSLGEIFKMNKSGFAVKAGTNQILLWTTNAFIDRDDEIFSTRGLERYVAEAEKRNEMGAVNLWHVKGTEFADVVAQGVMGRFLVELAEFRTDGKGRAMKAFFERYPEGHPEHAPEGWGCSPEFRYLPEERKAGVFENFWITDRAILPRWAAANIQTRATGGSKMTLITEKMESLFKEALGDDEFDRLVQAAEKESVELEAHLAHKAMDAAKVAGRLRAMAKKADDDMAKALEDLAAEMMDEDEDKEEKAEVPAPEIDLSALAAEIAGQLDVDVEPLAKQLDQLEKRLAAMETEKAKKAKVEALDKPRFVLSLEKRASQAVETALDENDPEDATLLKAGPKITDPDRSGSGAGHFFPAKK